MNYCVKALIDIGWIKVGNFARNNDKRVYAYLLTPKGIAEKAALTARFLRRKMDEYDALKAEIAQLQAELTGDDRSRGDIEAKIAKLPAFHEAPTAKFVAVGQGRCDRGFS